MLPLPSPSEQGKLELPKPGRLEAESEENEDEEQMQDASQSSSAQPDQPSSSSSTSSSEESSSDDEEDSSSSDDNNRKKKKKKGKPTPAPKSTSSISAEKKRKLKKKYKIKEPKRELARLTVVSGKKIENACKFAQWEKKLRSWEKSANIVWIYDRPDIKAKYPSLFRRADEALFIAIEGAVSDRVLLNIVQSDRVKESGVRALRHLRKHFNLSKDVFAVDLLDDTLTNCHINRGETVEEWLVRRRELEDLLGTTDRQKTDSQLLTLLRKSIPEELKEVNRQLTISGGKVVYSRKKYELALKEYARLIGFPSGDNSAAAIGDKHQINNALTVSTNQNQQNIKEIKGLEGLTSIQLAAIANLISGRDNKSGKKARTGNPSLAGTARGGDMTRRAAGQLHPDRIPDWVKEKEALAKQEKNSSKCLSVAEATDLLAKAKEAERKNQQKSIAGAVTEKNISDVASSSLVTASSDKKPLDLKWDFCGIVSGSSVSATAGVSSIDFTKIESTTFNFDNWIVDSGSVKHVTPKRDSLHDIILLEESEAQYLVVADGRAFRIYGHGDVDIYLTDLDGNTGKITLKGVAWAPDFSFNLLSVTKVQEAGGGFNFPSIKSGRKSVMELADLGVQIPISKWSNLPVIVAINNDGTSPINLTCVTTMLDMDVAHARLGHKSINSIKKLLPHVDGLSVDVSVPKRHCNSPCEACALQQRRQPIPKSPSPSRACVPNMRVFSDMSGPFSEDGNRVFFRPNNHSYIVMFIDDCTRRAIWFSTPNKESSSFLFCLERYMSVVGKSMAILRTDDARELCSEACNRFYAMHGIRRETTTPGSPQYNGVAEANIRTVMSSGRKMRSHAGLDASFGYFAAQAALVVYNNTPMRALPKGITPHQAWTGCRSDLSSIRVFGCRCWAHNNKSIFSKMDDRAREGIHLGAAPDSKGYYVYFPSSKRIGVTRNIIFDELTMPAKGISIATPPSIDPIPLPLGLPTSSSGASGDEHIIRGCRGCRR